MNHIDPKSKLPYLRRVTILEPKIPADGPPAHVGSKILLDGVEHPGLIDLHEGWTVHGSGLEASTVSFSVPADRAVMPQFDDSGDYTGGCLLDGIPVLSPTASPWEIYEPRGKGSLVRVYAFVASFEFGVEQPAETELVPVA